MNNPKFILPTGISGFGKAGAITIEDRYSEQFWQTCQQISALTPWQFARKVDHHNHPDFTYHLGVFISEDDSFLIFCHKSEGLIALSKVEENIDINTFSFDTQLPVNTYIDQSEISEHFPSPFRVLTADYLKIHTDADDLENAVTVSKLTLNEFAEFSYYEPHILGDIIFNSWKKER